VEQYESLDRSEGVRERERERESVRRGGRRERETL
jgi:hypothetical protein